jgi:hypothetical protein
VRSRPDLNNFPKFRLQRRPCFLVAGRSGKQRSQDSVGQDFFDYGCDQIKAGFENPKESSHGGHGGYLVTDSRILLLVDRLLNPLGFAAGQLAVFQGGPSRTGGSDEHI